MLGNLLLTTILATIILGAIGIRLAGGQGWKGAILGIVFIAGIGIGSSISQNVVLAIASGAILTGLVATLMKIPTKQSANALLGCLIGAILPTLLFY